MSSSSISDRAKERRAPVRDIAVIIPAGGLGTRLGLRTPKQFLTLGRTSILATTIQHFTRRRDVEAVIVAVPPAHMARARRALVPIRARPRVTVVAGGATRQESVALGLSAAPPVEIIVVHDAVRPFITDALIDRVVAAARADGAAVCALPIAETVKRVRNGRVEATIDRAGLVHVQTPQAFRAEMLREAHDKARRDGVVGTDEAMLIERLGVPVRVVDGLPENVKITTAADLARARRWIRR
jgi:2-C-methyl-D-erythritol 4-phosphate cytidylyltransferase